MVGPENVVVASVTKHNEDFAQKVAKFLGVETYVREVIDPYKFSCGEVCPTAGVDLTGKHLVLVGCADPHKEPEAVIYRAAEAAYIALNDLDARTVDLILPHMIKGRQDKGQKQRPNENLWKGKGVTLKFVAETLHNGGINRILTMHGHSEEMFNFFGEVWGKDGRDVVYEIIPAPIVAHYIKRHSSFDLSEGGARFVVVSPDNGARKFVYAVRDSLYLPNMVVVDINKRREKPSDPDSVVISIANEDELRERHFTFEGTSVLILDDMMDRGGTQINIVDFLNGKHIKFKHDFGRPADISEYFTHPVLGGDQYESTQEKIIKCTTPREVICTNTLPYIDGQQALMFQKRATVLRIAAYLADAFEYCCLTNTRPEDFYKFRSFEELERRMGGLYSIQRSEDMHFLEKRQ